LRDDGNGRSDERLGQFCSTYPFFFSVGAVEVTTTHSTSPKQAYVRYRYTSRHTSTDRVANVVVILPAVHTYGTSETWPSSQPDTGTKLLRHWSHIGTLTSHCTAGSVERSHGPASCSDLSGVASFVLKRRLFAACTIPATPRLAGMVHPPPKWQQLPDTHRLFCAAHASVLASFQNTSSRNPNGFVLLKCREVTRTWALQGGP